MKFQATLVLEFKASSIAEAGKTLNELLERAESHGQMRVAHVQLGTPQSAEPVVLPVPMPGPEPLRPPEPMPRPPTPPRYPPTATAS